MSPVIRLRRMPPPLFRPEGLPSAPGRRIAGLPESRILGESDFRLSPLDRRASRKVGVSALGCEIKEEVSAEGRYRGTFASKGTHPQLPAVCRRRAFFQWIEEKPQEGVVVMALHRRSSAATTYAVSPTKET